MPVRPDKRAGHDISVSVTIDSGGPGLLEVASELHEIVKVGAEERDDGLPRKGTWTLASGADIPNRDFVLSWRQTADAIQEATFVHTSSDPGEPTDGFFTMILQPPDRVADAEVRPRELVFVMDTSGSMRGFPIEKSKAVMTRAISAMRDDDTFNVITFAGHTSVLWDKPRPATAANRTEATSFVASRRGGGGTEMMAAINTALVQTVGDGVRPLTPRALADLPADDRRVDLAVAYERLQVLTADGAFRIPLDEDLWIPVRLEAEIPPIFSPEGVTIRLDGRWRTEDGRRILVADRARLQGRDDPVPPMRIVLFLTDGYVGNDMAIIDAVRANAHTTRVFSFGIGNSVNRYLLEGLARAGRGEAEFVLLDSDADAAVARLTKRIATPVLTDIELAFGDGLEVTDVLPAPDAIPDLFDAKPLVIHGRYKIGGEGTVTIRGRTGAGAYERAVALALPNREPEHDVVATLWARAKVDEVMTPHLKSIQAGNPPAEVRQEIVALGEEFRILTQYTSFVAVEKSRMTIGGRPVLVSVPIELPDGTSYEGFFGGIADKETAGDVVYLGQSLRSVNGQPGPASFALQQSTRGAVAQSSKPGGFGLGGTPEVGRRRKGPKRSAPGKGDTANRLGTGTLGAGRAKSEPPPQARTAAGKRDAPGKGGGGFAAGAVADRSAAPPPPPPPPPTPQAAVAGEEAATAPAEREDLTSTADGTAAAGLWAVEFDVDDAPEDAKKMIDGLRPEEEQVLLRDVETYYALTNAQDESVRLELARIPVVEEFFTQTYRPRPGVGRRPVFAEHVALLVAAFVDENRLEEARSLAGKLAAIRPDYAVGVQMRDTLADETLEANIVAERIASLGDQAKKELEKARERWLRQRRIERVVAPDLRAMTQGRPRVTVLVVKVDDATKNALLDAGLDLEDASESLPIVVGTVGLTNLEKLALVDGVRRIERTEFTSR